MQKQKKTGRKFLVFYLSKRLFAKKTCSVTKYKRKDFRNWYCCHVHVRILKIKVHEPEIKKIPRVDWLNEYLESEIIRMKEKAAELGEEGKASWEKLNEMFWEEV